MNSFIKFIILILISFSFTNLYASNELSKKKLVYITSDENVPFWQIMAKGIKNETDTNNISFEIYDAKNSSKRELELTVKAIKEKVSGIIISPTNSSACVTILKLANNANIPVVISDIGADSDDYVSYISSNNYIGAYEVGDILAKKMIKLNWQNGEVGIIAIPQKRLNGQKRTAGFMSALKKSNIKGATIKQMTTWTEEETYNYTKNMILDFPNLKAIWLQTSSMYNAAILALKNMKKEKDIILVAFDAEPEFLDLIPKGIILASGMQQPYLMGKTAAQNMIKHLNKEKVEKNIQIPILVVSTQNINDNLEKIYLNVLGKVKNEKK